jgi:hypothetical protein|tara:strand:+ start:1633 stop:1884 length:252 start_codon:yes stop_codon:yes gene_type:complete
MNKVYNKGWYWYDPVGYDKTDPPVGVERGILARGDRVQVKNQYGCPVANTMGHCHIESEAGELLGLIHVNSLTKFPKSIKGVA